MSHLMAAGIADRPIDFGLDVAHQIQSAFKPDRVRGWPGARVAARRIGSGVLGGDFHCTLVGGEQSIGLVLGSVRGNDFHASLAKALITGTLRALDPRAITPPVALQRLNNILAQVNKGFREPEIQCSIFFGVINRQTHALEYSAAGDTRAYVAARDGELSELVSSCPLLGSEVQVDCRTERLTLDDVARCIVASEGVLNTTGTTTDGTSRLLRTLRSSMHLAAEEQVDAILRSAKDRLGPSRTPRQDLTVLAVDFAAVARSSAEMVTKRLGRFERPGTDAPDSSVFLG